MGSCAKCGSATSIAGLEVVARAEGAARLDGRVFRNPEALLFKGTVTSPLRASACGQCGFVEFFIMDPGLLLRAAKSPSPRS